jgi:hypothetical protein
MSFWALRGWCSFTDGEAGPFASTVVGPGSVFRIVLPVLSAGNATQWLCCHNGNDRERGLKVHAAELRRRADALQDLRGGIGRPTDPRGFGGLVRICGLDSAMKGRHGGSTAPGKPSHIAAGRMTVAGIALLSIALLDPIVV